MAAGFRVFGAAVALALVVGGVACGRKLPPLPPVLEESVALNPEAVAGVSDPTLARLLSDQWEQSLANNPMLATMLGDHRYDDRLGDASEAALAAEKAERQQWLARAEAIDATQLSAADRETLALFLWERRSAVAVDACDFELWSFSPTQNVMSDVLYLPELHPLKVRSDAAPLLARYRAVPKLVDQTIANLRRGLAQGEVGNAASVQLAIAMADTQLAQPVGEWPLANNALVEGIADPAERAAALSDLRAAVETDVKPAFERWRAFIADDVAPVARPDDQVGLHALPKGKRCYAAVIERYTTLPKTPEELHATGLAELVKIHAEFQDLGERVYGTRDLPAIFERLRTDPTLYFANETEVEAKAVEALAKAKAAIPKYFGRLPVTDCVVRRTPDYEAPYSTIAYYRQPNPDGSKPGEYFVNTYAPTTRPRHEAEVLAYHESIPGHHLQIAIAQELPEMPAFRKNLDATAYVEGWALYSEALADEMGLYSGDTDELGRLSFSAWRASRLVVDTGLHDKGWSRHQAEQFLLDNTPLAPNNVANEVDRYINWPGQALAYKTGELEIRALRQESEAKLGNRFDIRGFHDVVLDGGPMTLPLLRERVERWQQSL